MLPENGQIPSRAMTLRLTVNRQAWLDHVRLTASQHGTTLPVVKGNGYGFGRPILFEQAVHLADHVAVGTVYEATDVPASLTPVVLTPVGSHIPHSLPARAVLTVGSLDHVASLRSHNWQGSVLMKLQSTMQRFGVAGNELAALQLACAQTSLNVVGYSIHPPLNNEGQDRSGEVSCWLELLTDSLPIHVSHLTAKQIGVLRSQFPNRTFISRIGTALWLGDKSMMKLTAEVLDVHPVAGGTAGYRSTALPGSGHIVIVGAGSAHGVSEIVGVGSPFHFAQQRVALVEPPFMHTSMLFVPEGQRIPRVGESLDVQQPLTRVSADTISWE
jgi:alanine racemase